MRGAFLHALLKSAETNPELWLLCGDLGFGVLEPFAKQFPERFINVGVAEQNMVGVAAGLAMTGKKVVCYSIGNFATLRCLEQIRNDVCYHKADVKIVSVGGGLVYGAHGYTHHTIEDLGVMRTLPNLTIIAPGDPMEAKLATQEMLAQEGPCYLRLGKAGEPGVHQTPPEFAYGRMIELQQGKELLLISTGGMLKLATEVAAALSAMGIRAGVASCPFVKPLDEDYLARQATRYPWIVTLEEHTRAGGLNEAVASLLAQLPQATRLVPFYVPEEALHGIAGNHGEMLARIGFTAEAIAQKLKGIL